MTAENKKSIKYKDIDSILEDISGAPEISREEQEVKGKKALMKALEKGILSLLKKGYSIKATTVFINERLAPASISESDVKQLLSKVTTKKKTSRVKTAKTATEDEAGSTEGDKGAQEIKNLTTAPSDALNLQKTDVEINSAPEKDVSDAIPLLTHEKHEKVYLSVPHEDREKVKSFGAKWDSSIKKWYVPKGANLKNFAPWLDSSEETK